MGGKQFNCVICNDPFLRETRGPVITCQKDECKYLNSRVTRMNANRKQRGIGRACGRYGTELPEDSQRAGRSTGTHDSRSGTDSAVRRASSLAG